MFKESCVFLSKKRGVFFLILIEESKLFLKKKIAFLVQIDREYYLLLSFLCVFFLGRDMQKWKISKSDFFVFVHFWDFV